MKAIGTELQEARHARGLTLEEVSAATKVPVRILEDIEANHLDRLPGGVFARAHLRAYAGEVGVDADAVVDAYIVQRFGGLEEELPIERRPPVEPEPHRTRTLLLEVAAVAMVVAVYGSCGPSGQGSGSSAVTSPERGARPAAAAVAPEGYVDTADDQALPAPGGAAEPPAVRTTGGNDDASQPGQPGAEPG